MNREYSEELIALADEHKTKYPIELYRDEYENDFTRAALLFFFFQCEESADSHENGMFIKWMFYEIVCFTMNAYDNLRNNLFLNLNDNNDIYDESCNGQNWTFKFDLGGKINEYFKNHHDKYKVGIDAKSLERLQKQYRMFMSNHSNKLNELLRLLFDNFIRKIDKIDFVKCGKKIGERKYVQSVQYIRGWSDGQFIDVNLNIDRDYFHCSHNKSLIDNYLLIEDSFESKYYNVFKEWFDKIKKLTNNFDEITFGEYVFANYDKNIAKVFEMPHHKNKILVELMMDRFKICDIPPLKYGMNVPVADSQSQHVHKIYRLKGQNINSCFSFCIMEILDDCYI